MSDLVRSCVLNSDPVRSGVKTLRLVLGSSVSARLSRVQVTAHFCLLHIGLGLKLK